LKNILTQLQHLPGLFVLEPGTRADFLALMRFHYLKKPPATWARILAVRHQHTVCGNPVDTLAAVAVMSWPVPMLGARRDHFKLHSLTYKQSIQFANEHFRTLSRVVVHPRYRALGLASLLCRDMARDCPTTYLESSARMGDYSPFLLRAGFEQICTSTPDRPAYFLFKKPESATPQIP